jgi:hypothetical protein
MKSHVILLVFLLSGCAGADLVSTTVLPDGGVVRYKNGNFVREKSREIAVEKMQRHCSPKAYKILKEEFNPDVFSVKLGESHYSAKDSYMFISFSCE